ncbi:glycosyl hydrolase family 65 protein [Nocardia sp. CDC160]|uniref:glycosyl hydrolase family 65 protein n=1 Tax=Nocardia sp. CDC160 TaxID=3112166 RepID=UPI002DBA6C74|nr:glycosyl hydrolase family 65 protein [Nocardia sp. CDC160]MEC3918703.1 glycosyl hydrolase family 65 protein [Nocardia sp. CDC160]
MTAPDPAADVTATPRAVGDRTDLPWTITGNAVRHNVSDATVYTVGSGGIASRGVVEEATSTQEPQVLVAGVYTGTGPEEELMAGPTWTRLELAPMPRAEQFLDLRSGVLYRADAAGEFRSLRFACAARPGVMVMRVEAPGGLLAAEQPLLVPPEAAGDTTDIPGLTQLPGIETRGVRVESASGSAIAAAAAQSRTHADGIERLDRVAVFAADDARRTGVARVLDELPRVWERGVDRLLAEQRATWARRWSTVGIDLPDDPETEQAVRFALFQLWSNAGAHGESAVGARGISGSGYRGHVFWDADAFVLPAMVSIDPEAAEAIVAYRLRRLDAARERARAEGRRGARFPWESATDGTDVTPRAGFLGGAPVPILTGTLEEHITADVAWGADHFAEWAGRTDYLATTARELLVETARYWASRLRLDAHGRAHLDQVIGPDEYHETVDDNAFTNVMARWNLRRAARLHPENADEAKEFAAWRDLADRIVDQLGPDGRYEQFTGYFGLEPLLAAEVAHAPVAADVLLGQRRVAGSQLIKQPDVLMLHHLLPDDVAPGTLLPNLDFYGPRTTHGSSLSPAVMAALLARAGRPDEAFEALRPALRLDLDDRSGSTASGLHLATLGGVWQAMLSGFAGARVHAGVLSLRPVLPRRWSRLGLAFRCLGRCVRLEVTPEGVGVHTDGPLRVAVGDRPARLVASSLWWPAIEENAS